MRFRGLIGSVLVLMLVATGCRITTVAGGGSQAPTNGAVATDLDLSDGVRFVEVRDDGVPTFVVGTTVLSRQKSGLANIVYDTGATVGSPALGNGVTYIPLPDSGDIAIVTPGGTSIIDLSPASPVSIATGPAGGVFVGLASGEVRQLTGSTLTALNGPPAFTLDGPDGIRSFDVDPAGRLVGPVGDRVVRFDAAGSATTVAGTSTAGFGGDNGPATAALLDTPMGVSIASDGWIYVADRNNHRIRRIESGIIATVAGDGTAGYSGELGEATVAQLDSPGDVAAQALGRLTIADTGNDLLRVVAGDALPDRYVALGDSYSAGTGLNSYDPGPPDCQRSPGSWPRLLAGTGSVPANISHVACVSAMTEDLIASQMSGQPAQLDTIAASGDTDPTVKVITVSIGGNDLDPGGLAGVLVPCLDIFGIGGDCEQTIGPAVEQALIDLELGSATQLPIVDYLDEILTRAPEATVHIMGYPHLFSTNPADYPFGRCGLFLLGLVAVQMNDAFYLNDLLDQSYTVLDNAVAASIDPSRVSVVDMRPAFDGHEVCSSSPWLNGVELTLSNTLVGESFHPNSAGYAAMTAAMHIAIG